MSVGSQYMHVVPSKVQKYEFQDFKFLLHLLVQTTLLLNSISLHYIASCSELYHIVWTYGMLSYCWGVSRAWSRYGRGATREGVGECWPARRRTPQDHCWPRQLSRCRKLLGWWCHLHPQASDESATKMRKEMNKWRYNDYHVDN